MNTFSKQPEVQRKALQKALQSPKIGKHGKRHITILKDEVQRRMQEKILYNVNALIEAQMEVALTGNNGKPDIRAIDSLLNRVFGRPVQEVTVKSNRMVEVDLEAQAAGDKAIHEYLLQRTADHH